jgi:hypothetical protein
VIGVARTTTNKRVTYYLEGKDITQILHKILHFSQAQLTSIHEGFLSKPLQGEENL